MSPSQGTPGYPKMNQIYTLEQIEGMPLDDIPGLDLKIENKWSCVQTSHINSEDMFKNCPELKSSLWRYVETTDEWIPIFNYAGPEEDIPKLFDWEAYRDPYIPEGKDPGWWVTPKGSPREQFYSENGED